MKGHKIEKPVFNGIKTGQMLEEMRSWHTKAIDLGKRLLKENKQKIWFWDKPRAYPSESKKA